LEQIPQAFAEGYNAALEAPGLPSLRTRLADLPPQSRGFGYEGAAMASAILDHLTPWRRTRSAAFLREIGDPHVYLVHVGFGWAAARLRRDVARARSRWDPLLSWLLTDGYGFHQGFFHWRRFAEGQSAPAQLTGYDRRAFDQGLGRSLWFVGGADPQRIRDLISRFANERRADLWSGVGLAAAYAGCVGEEELRAVVRFVGEYRSHLAQGAAFAAKARQRADILLPTTDLATRILCGLSAIEAARVTDRCLAEATSAPGQAPAYEGWRARIRDCFGRPCPGDRR
jgi:hypothetical protein